MVSATASAGKRDFGYSARFDCGAHGDEHVEEQHRGEHHEPGRDNPSHPRRLSGVACALEEVVPGQRALDKRLQRRDNVEAAELFSTPGGLEMCSI